MVCGNIARSRCPLFSRKGCCVKAGNSCHIYVLKPSPTGDSVQSPAAAASPQEASYINTWRFRKLRAHIEDINSCEDEAFDRYMRNMILLEELFNGSHADSCEEHASQGASLTLDHLRAEKTDGGIDVAIVPVGLRLRQRLSSKKREAHKQRLKRTIDRSLQKLHKGEEVDDIVENEDFHLNAFAARRELKRMEVQSADGKERLRRMEVFSVLVDKLKAVENQEDFDLCLKTYEENFLNHKANGSKHEGVSQMVASEQHMISGLDAGESTKAPTQKSNDPDLTFNTSFN